MVVIHFVLKFNTFVFVKVIFRIIFVDISFVVDVVDNVAILVEVVDFLYFVVAQVTKSTIN